MLLNEKRESAFVLPPGGREQSNIGGLIKKSLLCVDGKSITASKTTCQANDCAFVENALILVVLEIVSTPLRPSATSLEFRLLLLLATVQAKKLKNDCCLIKKKITHSPSNAQDKVKPLARMSTFQVE